MTENEKKAQNQISRIANHNLIDKQLKTIPEEIEVYEKKFTSLKPSMFEKTLQEIIWSNFETFIALNKNWEK